MKKTAILGITLALITAFSTPCLADTVNLINGTTLRGKIERITGEIINIETDEGFMKLTRIQVVNNIDFVKIGFFDKKFVTGKVFSANSSNVELKTADGLLQIPRYKVRDMIIGYSHTPETETNGPPIDLDPFCDDDNPN